MKEKLKEFCKTLEIEYVGIAPPGPYYDLEKILKDRIERGHYSGFEEKILKNRIHPELTLPGVKSIIVCLFPYFIGNNENSNISKYTFAVDYHFACKDKLEKIGEYLSNNIGDFHYKAFVDTGPLVDRQMAYLAGLGFWGINTHIITDKYGSYFFIGYIMTDYPFEPDKPQDRTCMQCGNCVRKCPGAAILGNFEMNPLRCKSYITQKKGELTESEKEIMRKSRLVFGCDICQDVCPHNRKVEHTIMEEFKRDIMYNIDYGELTTISNKEFLRRYRNRAFSWRGSKIVIRNFEILKNKQ